MYKFLIFTALFALCSARPGNIGYGLSAGSYSAIAAPIVSVAPAVSVNSGISTQSRVDYRTPNVIAAPAYASSLAVPAIATSSLGSGYGGIGGYGGSVGYGGNVGYGVNGVGYGLGLGH